MKIRSRVCVAALDGQDLPISNTLPHRRFTPFLPSVVLLPARNPVSPPFTLPFSSRLDFCGTGLFVYVCTVRTSIDSSGRVVCQKYTKWSSGCTSPAKKLEKAFTAEAKKYFEVVLYRHHQEHMGLWNSIRANTHRSPQRNNSTTSLNHGCQLTPVSLSSLTAVLRRNHACRLVTRRQPLDCLVAYTVSSLDIAALFWVGIL
ncbi:hypothetical protein IWZ00DRAFT_267666 [Phyllosticta capitalensis]